MLMLFLSVMSNPVIPFFPFKGMVTWDAGEKNYASALKCIETDFASFLEYPLTHGRCLLKPKVLISGMALTYC